MEVNIVSKHQNFLSTHVIIGTDNGEITILDNHAPLIGFGNYFKTENQKLNHHFVFKFFNNILYIY